MVEKRKRMVVAAVALLFGANAVLAREVFAKVVDGGWKHCEWIATSTGGQTQGCIGGYGPSCGGDVCSGGGVY